MHSSNGIIRPLNWLNKRRYLSKRIPYPSSTAHPIKICLFIDGLDEYVEKLFEIIQLIKKPTTSKPVKICLSSGTWNVF
jgi:hypothetical protein